MKQAMQAAHDERRDECKPKIGDWVECGYRTPRRLLTANGVAYTDSTQMEYVCSHCVDDRDEDRLYRYPYAFQGAPIAEVCCRCGVFHLCAKLDE